MKKVKYPQVGLEIKKCGNNPASFMQLLHGSQVCIGCLLKRSLQYITEKVKVSLSKVYSVVTFYSFLKILY